MTVKRVVVRALVVCTAGPLWIVGLLELSGDASWFGYPAIAVGALVFVIGTGGRFSLWLDGVLSAGAPAGGPSAPQELPRENRPDDEDYGAGSP